MGNKTQKKNIKVSNIITNEQKRQIGLTFLRGLEKMCQIVFKLLQRLVEKILHFRF